MVLHVGRADVLCCSILLEVGKKGGLKSESWIKCNGVKFLALGWGFEEDTHVECTVLKECKNLVARMPYARIQDQQ